MPSHIHAIMFVEEATEFTLQLSLVYLHEKFLYTVEQVHSIRDIASSDFDWLSLAREEMERLILNLISQSNLTIEEY